MATGATSNGVKTPTMNNAGSTPIEEALETIRQGGFVVVMDNEDRENEGDLIAAAEFATEERLAFMLRHTTGIVCAGTSSSPGRAAASLDGGEQHGSAQVQVCRYGGSEGGQLDGCICC